MRTITKISTQKKSSNRYNIFLDGVYAFSIEEDVLVKFQLRKGLTLSEAEISTITESDAHERSYLLAIHYLSYRMRSIKEMRTYLKEKEVAQIAIDKVIKRLITENVLNDALFADAHVTDRMNLTSKGPQLIVRELQEKGVTAEIAQKAVMKYPYEKQFKTALKWAKRERNKKSRHSFRKRNEQLQFKLLQKGFTNDVVTDVMQHLSLEMDQEEELSNLSKEATKLYKRYSKKYEGYELKTKIKAGLYNRGFSGELINEYVANLEE